MKTLDFDSAAFSLISSMQRLYSKVQLLGCFKCFSLSYHSESSDRCTPRSILSRPGSRPQVWWGVLSVSLGGLQLTIWLCGQRRWSADHPVGSCCHTTPQARAGNRKKKAGHPVHLDQRAKRDITKASPFRFLFLFFLINHLWSEANLSAAWPRCASL